MSKVTAPAAAAAADSATVTLGGVASRANAFDFLRLFAAVVVVFQHLNHDFGTNVGWGATRLFDGVAIFFVLSGMLVWASAERLMSRGLGWRTFYLNRYLRIAPALYAFAVIAPLALVAVGSLSLAGLLGPQTLVWFGSFALLIPNYLPPAFADPAWANINGPLWTIPAEISFYLMVPVLFWAARRWGLVPTAIVMIVASMAARAVSTAFGDTAIAVVHHTFLELGPYFAVGILVARYGARLPLRWWLALVAGALQSVMLVLGPSDAFLPVYGPLKPLLLAAPLAYLLLYAGLRLGPVLQNIASTIGDLSFGVYIWHCLVAAVVTALGFAGTPTSTVAVAVVALLIAACSWRLIERPCLALKRSSARAPGQSGVAA